MKRSAKILCALFIIIMLASCVVMAVSAGSAYQTYTYSIGGYALYSPDAYVADANIVTSETMGLEVPLSKNVSDLTTDDKDNVYIADTGNNRIVCLDRYYNKKFIINTFVNDKGVDDKLNAPQGLYVSSDRIWV